MYAELALYCPEESKRQAIESWTSIYSIKFAARPARHRIMKSSTRSSGPCSRRSRTHASFVSVAASDLFFLLDLLSRFGNNTTKEEEVSHGECQKEVVAPFPIVTVVAEANLAMSFASHGISEPVEGLSSCYQASHSRRRWICLDHEFPSVHGPSGNTLFDNSP